MRRGGGRFCTLSATMAQALNMARQHGNQLVRYSGGFWSHRDAVLHADGVPARWYGASTVAALVKRGDMKYTDSKQALSFNFPIEATIVETPQSRLEHERQQSAQDRHRSKSTVNVGDGPR